MADELAAFVGFCRDVLTTENGKPMVVEPFQQTILRDYFGGARETVVIVGKKNGKSSLLGALAVFHVLTTPEAECVIVAASRDQAGIMLRQVQGYVRRSPALRERLKVVQREVRVPRSGGRIRVLAADSDTLDGQIPTLALIDELARTKTEEAYGLLRDGLGPRDGRLIAISTAGDDEESPLGRLRTAAHAMDGFTRDGGHKHVRRGRFAWHEWSLDLGDDINDLALLKSVNPASWVDEDELRARRDSPSTRPWQLARFTAGLWMAGEDSAISGKEWAACADPDLRIPSGAGNVIIGGDLGYTVDCTAFVAAWESPDGLMLLDDPVILEPPGDGTSIDVEDMMLALHEYADRYPGCAFAFDEQFGGQQLLQRLQREIPTSRHLAYPQNPSKMAAASMGFAELVATRKLRHPAHPGLTDHVLAAAARFIGDQRWRFVKPKGKRFMWIDAAVAAAMACDLAGNVEPERVSVYEMRATGA